MRTLTNIMFIFLKIQYVPLKADFNGQRGKRLFSKSILPNRWAKQRTVASDKSLSSNFYLNIYFEHNQFKTEKIKQKRHIQKSEMYLLKEKWTCIKYQIIWSQVKMLNEQKDFPWDKEQCRKGIEVALRARSIYQ